MPSYKTQGIPIAVRYAHKAPLPHPRQKELVRAYQENDNQEALEELVRTNARFVIDQASHFFDREPIDPAEVVAYGMEGLICAAGRFDAKYGVNFLTYAVHWINQSIRAGLQGATGPVNTRQSQAANHHKYCQMRAEMDGRTDRLSTDREIADALGWSENKWETFATFRRAPINIDGHNSTNDPFEQGNKWSDAYLVDDAPSAEEQVIEEERRERIQDLISLLDARDQRIVRRYFGFSDIDGEVDELEAEGRGCGMTLEAIGEIEGITRERVRQLLNRAKETLRVAINSGSALQSHIKSERKEAIGGSALQGRRGNAA